MKNLPQQVKGRRWRVKIVKRLRRDGLECWGSCEHDDHIIILTEATYRHGIDRDIFVHEFTHKAFSWMGEELIEAIEDGLSDVLDANDGDLQMPIRKQMKINCPWMNSAAINLFALDLTEALEVMGL